MKTIFFFIIFALNCYGAFSALGIYPPSEYPAGKCWFDATQRSYDVNESFKFGKNFCGRYTCLSTYSVQVATCGSVGAPPGCYVADGDLSLDYPYCCPKNIICDSKIPRQPRV